MAPAAVERPRVELVAYGAAQAASGQAHFSPPSELLPVLAMPSAWLRSSAPSIDYGWGAPYIARRSFPERRPRVCAFLNARVFKGISCSPDWQRASSDRPTIGTSEAS